MNETDIDFRKHFEEVTNKNVEAMIDYCKETRKLNYNLESRVESLQNTVMAYDERIKLLTTQISMIQAKLYAGGIT